ncbi:MAG TPA: ATP-binding protein [Gemmatimonadales bacterium]|nr:ATP-binding protein [Gemmatimonadales bacterium]
MTRHGAREGDGGREAIHLGLRAKLLLLLLAFGVTPLILAIGLGYVASRATITTQAEEALREVTERQAAQLATELSRERLLLRTIAGQLPGAGQLLRTPPEALSRLLIQSLPEGGVFDGLRIVTDGGRVLASVALRNTEPHWPARAPATSWVDRQIVVHRSGAGVLAYLLAVPAIEPPVAAWLEGHVRAEDFRRILGIPEHLMGGAESGLFERTGAPVLLAHEHSGADLSDALRVVGVESTTTVQRDRVGRMSALVAVAPIAGTDWALITALPLNIALAPLARVRNTALAGAALFVVLIVLTSLPAAATVVTPLRALAAAARQFGERGRHEPLPQPTRDEVGDLVRSFNRMTEDLERSRAEIGRLHAQDLERAQQLATVGELASGIAHEIRNPLTGVLGALDLALRKLPADDPARPLLHEAELQLKRIETATTQLLRFARPPELRTVPVDANLLVDRALRLVEPQAKARGVQLRREPVSEAIPVNADPELMVQVLVNLLLNGVDASPDNGRVTVRVTRQGEEVRIGVEDQGPGVPPELRTEIFRPFFTTKHLGTGLGLSISRQIAQRHGGSLHLEDAPGGGATFVVALPIATKAERRE